jgi:hypothetical protein
MKRADENELLKLEVCKFTIEKESCAVVILYRRTFLVMELNRWLPVDRMRSNSRIIAGCDGSLIPPVWQQSGRNPPPID